MDAGSKRKREEEELEAAAKRIKSLLPIYEAMREENTRLQQQHTRSQEELTRSQEANTRLQEELTRSQEQHTQRFDELQEQFDELQRQHTRSQEELTRSQEANTTLQEEHRLIFDAFPVPLQQFETFLRVNVGHVNHEAKTVTCTPAFMQGLEAAEQLELKSVHMIEFDNYPDDYAFPTAAALQPWQPPASTEINKLAAMFDANPDRKCVSLLLPHSDMEGHQEARARVTEWCEYTIVDQDGENTRKFFVDELVKYQKYTLEQATTSTYVADEKKRVKLCFKVLVEALERIFPIPKSQVTTEHPITGMMIHNQTFTGKCDLFMDRNIEGMAEIVILEAKIEIRTEGQFWDAVYQNFGYMKKYFGKRTTKKLIGIVTDGYVACTMELFPNAADPEVPCIQVYRPASLVHAMLYAKAKVGCEGQDEISDIKVKADLEFDDEILKYICILTRMNKKETTPDDGYASEPKSSSNSHNDSFENTINPSDTTGNLVASDSPAAQNHKNVVSSPALSINGS